MANTLKIIPFGGLGEVGKNMMAVEYDGRILLIDCGVMFPENDMLGIDLVIPDFGYLTDKKDLVCGIVITHGHEDHIGALPYLLKEIPIPVYAGRLTRGLIEVKLKRSPLKDQIELHTVMSGERVNIGPFNVEFFRVNHSIPDGMGIAIRTPAGMVIHSGDFKFDHSPVSGKTTDFAKLATLGNEGVLVLMADSTNAESPGFTPSEKVVEAAFDEVFRHAAGRVIVATFASLVSRVQQVIDVSARHDRKVAIVGRSMVDNVHMAQDLGYLNVPRDILIRPEDLDKYSPWQVVIIATGSQGEPTSALARMARGDRYGPKTLQIATGDTVIISAHPIPGNEEMVNHIIDDLFRLGANVIYSDLSDVHVSGHGSREDHKMMLSLVRPRFFMPMHGEYRHLVFHARTAQSMGIPPENIVIVESGQVVEVEPNAIRAGERVSEGHVLVDGLSIGEIGSAVLRDRQHLARDGFLVAIVARNPTTGEIVADPEILTRGFVYVAEADDLIEGAKNRMWEVLRLPATGSSIRNKIKDVLSQYCYTHTGRRPLILPLVLDV
jgi:ribonuclease J